jgi:hypothetical protein
LAKRIPCHGWPPLSSWRSGCNKKGTHSKRTASWDREGLKVVRLHG